MNSEVSEPEAPLPPAEPAAQVPQAKAQRSNNQIRASAVAEGIAVRARWQALVPAAKSQWEKIPNVDLLTVDGNFHRLAGLVQQRYGLGREESDRQARAFFDLHQLRS